MSSKRENLPARARILVRAKLQIFANPMLGDDGPSYDFRKSATWHVREYEPCVDESTISYPSSHRPSLHTSVIKLW